MEIDLGTSGSASARHAASWTQAFSITISPMREISPLDSAKGMNSCGGIRPCFGWSQRTSASMLHSSPVRVSTRGW